MICQQLALLYCCPSGVHAQQKTEQNFQNIIIIAT